MTKEGQFVRLFIKRMSTHADSLYVETFIRGPMDEVWRLTQTPNLHERWDLRFTHIEYLPHPDKNQPQRFLYATRIGFGLNIQGEGETTGNRHGPSGERTSALKFWSHDLKSLICEGSGYWKYLPSSGGVRFVTGYDYEVRFGRPGQLIDRLVFRPLMGWATAWSFDRLRLWIEKGLDPSLALRLSLIHALARLTLAFVWLYHGLVPKIIFSNLDEIRMLIDAGASSTAAPVALQIVGWSEVSLGVLMLVAWRARRLFFVNIGLLLLALFGVGLNSPGYLAAAFNPVTLNGLMIALSVIGLLVSTELPSARNCLRKPKETA